MCTSPEDAGKKEPLLGPPPRNKAARATARRKAEELAAHARRHARGTARHTLAADATEVERVTEATIDGLAAAKVQVIQTRCCCYSAPCLCSPLCVCVVPTSSLPLVCWRAQCLPLAPWMVSIDSSTPACMGAAHTPRQQRQPQHPTPVGQLMNQ